MREEAKEKDPQSRSIQLMFDNDLQKFVCSSGKQCKTLGFFKRHLVNIHNWLFRDNEDPTPESSCESETDKVANYYASFMKMLYCLGIRMMHFLCVMETVLCVMPDLNFFVQMFGNMPNIIADMENCGLYYSPSFSKASV